MDIGHISILKRIGKSRCSHYSERIEGALAIYKNKSSYGYFHLLVVIGSVVLRLLPRDPEEVTILTVLAGSLLLIWAGLSGWAALVLFTKNESGTYIASIVGAIGLVFSLPVLIAGGGIVAFLLAVSCGIGLYLLWHKHVQSYRYPYPRYLPFLFKCWLALCLCAS